MRVSGLDVLDPHVGTIAHQLAIQRPPLANGQFANDNLDMVVCDDCAYKITHQKCSLLESLQTSSETNTKLHIQVYKLGGGTCWDFLY